MSTNVVDEDDDYSENIENLIELLNISGKSDIKIESVKFSSGSSSGDNYMSKVKRILVQGRDISDSYDIQQSFIVKRQIPSLSRRQLYRCDEAFNNEISAYNHVVPMLEQCTVKESPFPKCFYAGRDSDGEIIILDDLKQFGFQMKNRLADMDFEHCSIVMKELSKWHAASIISKKVHLNYEACTKKLSEIVYCPEAENFYKQILDSSINDSIESLRRSNTDGQLTKPIEMLEPFREILFDVIKGYVTQNGAGSKNPRTVVCHGDLWINNIMFKWNSQGAPIGCKFFDLQAMRCTSPAFDILHFIFTSTKRSLRDSYLTNLLKTYIASLHEHLELLASKSATVNVEDCEEIKKLFSFGMIEGEVYKYILYGLAVAMWILPAVTFETIPNLDAISEKSTAPKEFKMSTLLTNEYHSRIKDLLLEFYENEWFTLEH